MVWDKVNLYFLKGLLDVHFPAIKLRVTSPNNPQHRLTFRRLEVLILHPSTPLLQAI